MGFELCSSFFILRRRELFGAGVAVVTPRRKATSPIKEIKVCPDQAGQVE